MTDKPLDLESYWKPEGIGGIGSYVFPEELKRELRVTLLRKEVIRLRKIARETTCTCGDTCQFELAAEALEAKIEQFLESGIWPEPLRGGGE